MMNTPSVGDLLRRWRNRRELSQLDLAGEADVSARHLSFIETGRSLPSREVILRIAECLQVPLRERNVLLLAGGYAPAFRESRLSDPEMRSATHAIGVILHGHEPYPALVYDKHWTLIDANEAMKKLLEGVAKELLQPPVNILRIAMHPRGLASRILNFDEWRAYTFRRLEREIDVTGDPIIRDLFLELSGFGQPIPASVASQGQADYTGLIIRLQIVVNGSPLSFFSASTVLGTPVDITLSELAIESFFPADDNTAAAMRQLVRTDLGQP